MELKLQSDLDQSTNKFRRLPVEIQEFVQDSSKAKLSDGDSVHGNLVASSTTEKLNHKASQSEGRHGGMLVGTSLRHAPLEIQPRRFASHWDTDWRMCL
ncbi:hypothetical protein F7725_019373 [Dissostichus mawsoni]|uniref:Uncharacterized protein n=1 Tax=Dissostichus mawsoni TaxID=36200 RepID=A0A7J5YJJ4_DISMA|nr:hypothetical protein F7725_019373 [Dissostichus mawsoni]